MMKPPIFRPQDHSRIELVAMRVLFALVLIDVIPSGVVTQELTMPVGLAGMGMDLSWLPKAMPVLKALSWPVLLVYALGRLPALTTTYLFAVTVLVGTYANSNGSIKHHHQVVSLILLAQVLWHWWWLARHRRKDLSHADDPLVRDRWAAFASQQAIVAAYVVTGLTKVATSGFFGWIKAAANYPVQLRKTNLQAAYSRADVNTAAGSGLESWLVAHPAASNTMLGAGLVLELGAFLALLGRPWSFTYGILLIAFHAMNSVFMNLNFRWHNQCLFIFLILPPMIAAGRRVFGRK
jgi:hypothetical protein